MDLIKLRGFSPKVKVVKNGHGQDLPYELVKTGYVVKVVKNGQNPKDMDRICLINWLKPVTWQKWSKMVKIQRSWTCFEPKSPLFNY